MVLILGGGRGNSVLVWESKRIRWGKFKILAMGKDDKIKWYKYWGRPVLLWELKMIGCGAGIIYVVLEVLSKGITK